MGVLYEHWRLDTNECFYVGISWAQVETRPYDFSSRNAHYANTINHISLKLVEVRIQAEIDDKNELCELEKLQILYWRNKIGKRLTNIAPGGEGYVPSWTDETRLKMGESVSRARLSPELNAKIRRISKVMWTDSNYVEKIKAARKVFMDSKKYRDKQREKSKLIWSDTNRIEKQRSRSLKTWSSDKLRREQATRSSSGWKNPEIKKRREDGIRQPEARRKNSDAKSAHWKNPNFRVKMMLRDWWFSVTRLPYWGA